MPKHVIICNNQKCEDWGMVINIATVSDTQRLRNSFHVHRNTEVHDSIDGVIIHSDFCPKCRRLGIPMTTNELLVIYGADKRRSLWWKICACADNGSAATHRVFLPHMRQVMMIEAGP